MLKTLRVYLFAGSIFSFIITAPFIPNCIHQYILYYTVKWLRIICNVKVNVYGDKELLKNSNDIYMANHYEGVDFNVLLPLITTPYSSKCYTIAKDDLLGRQYPIYSLNNIVDYAIKLFYEGGNLIPYTRGNKDSGIQVKQMAKKILNNNNKLLIFPEGRSWRKGISYEFKPGIFKVAEECKKTIIPLTLKYRNFDGKNKGEKCIIEDWMDIEVDVFIHDKVEPKNYNDMLQETFEKITSKN